MSVLAAAAVALVSAAPAAAIVPPADGYYTFHEEGVPAANWEMQSICMQANGTRAQPDYTDETIQTLGCNVILSSKTPGPAMTRPEKLVSFDGRALLTGGLWTVSVQKDDGFLCPDGSTGPSTETYAFSEATLTGTHKTVHPEQCGVPAGVSSKPFTLAFVGPLDPPVQNRFPDNCNYLIGRPSICS